MNHLPPDTPRMDQPTDTTPDAHARVWALIPWLVNGRADAADRAVAEQHLLRCAECRAELAAQQRLRQGVQDHLPAAAAGLDAERGLQRLLGRLDQLPLEQDGADPARATPGARPRVAEAGVSGLPAQAAAAAPRRAGRLHAALAAAVVAQAVGLALLSLQLMRSDDAPYRTLSQPTAAAAAPAAYRVAPDPALPMQQWQALLDDTQLRVVDGPNAAGAYALAPRAAASAAASDAASAAVLARLRADPGVRLAEALGPAP
jgi:hypothetical protein